MDQLNDKLPEPLDRALKALDAEAARAAARVDATRMAEGVLRGLREQPSVAVRPRWVQTWLRVAAAVVLLVIGAVVARQLARPERVGEVAVSVPDSMSDTQVQALLNAMDSLPVSVDSAPALVITTESLDESELLTLLQTMDPSEDIL